MRKIAIADHGGFHLEHEIIMKYAEKKGIVLYPIVRKLFTLSFSYEPSNGHDGLFIRYSTKPLKPNGDLEEGSEVLGSWSFERDDPILIQAIEELDGTNSTSNIKIVEIPDDVEYEIEDYEGEEWVSEKHRTWGKPEYL